MITYVAMRYVDRLLNVSPRLAAEVVQAGLLLLLLQLQRLDLGLQFLQLVLQMFALLHVLQPASTQTRRKQADPNCSSASVTMWDWHSPLSLDLHRQPFHVRVLEVEARRCRVVGKVRWSGWGRRSRGSRAGCYELKDQHVSRGGNQPKLSFFLII